MPRRTVRGPLTGPHYRAARRADAEAIAALHADSWRRYYRGAYSDAFLDGDVVADRLAVWSDRLRDADAVGRTLVAEEHGALVGFAHTIFDHDPTWGALLDNLHVAAGNQRRGIGTRLVSFSRAEVRAGMYLWVLEQNVAAQAFYEACGARCVGRAAVEPPGGVAGRLNGSPAKLRYAWE